MCIRPYCDDLTAHILVEFQDIHVRMCVTHILVQASGIDLYTFPFWDDYFENLFKHIIIICHPKDLLA